MYYFLHITVSSSCTDLLEGVFNLEGLFHLTLHFFLEKLTPHLLDHEVFSELYFIRVFILIGCCFSNFTLTSDSVHAFLECILFVTDTRL